MYEDWTTEELVRWRNQMATEFRPNMSNQDRQQWAARYSPVHGEIMRRVNGGGEVIDDYEESPSPIGWPLAGIVLTLWACGLAMWVLVSCL